MSDARPDTSGWTLPAQKGKSSLPDVAWQHQTRLVVTTKYLSQFISVWQDADAVDDLSAMAAELASNLGNLHFRLAEPKESLNTEWVVLPPGVVNESVVRLQVRRKGELAEPPTV